MKIIKVEINLYSYNELNEKSKEYVLDEHRNFLIDNPSDYEDENGNIKYFEEEDYTDEYVIDSINANEYLFFKDGKMADCVTFTGKHKKSGITEFYFMDKTYILY